MIEIVMVVASNVVLVGWFLAFYLRERYWRSRVLLERKDAIERSRATIEGKTFEQIIPYLPGFEWQPSDCRFLGSPIDMVVFDGLSTNCVKEVIILEIKTGKSKTTKRQNSIKKAVNEGKVSWKELKINDNSLSNRL